MKKLKQILKNLNGILEKILKYFEKNVNCIRDFEVPIWYKC